VSEVNFCKAHPVVFYALLSSLDHFDPVTAANVSDELKISLEPLEKLVDAGKLLSDAPVRRLVSLLKSHKAFPRISYTAGELAFARTGFQFTGVGLSSVLKEAMVSLTRILPRITSEVFELPVPRITVRNSPFVDYPSSFPTCGFVAGFISSALLSARMVRFRIRETICASISGERQACLFEVEDSFYDGKAVYGTGA